MRKDCTIDNRQVICPNASLLGFGTCVMKAGKCFLFGDGTGAQRFARSLGRVTALVTTDDNRRVEKSFVLAAVLYGGDSLSERWVDPAEVLEILPDPPRKIMAFMLQDQLPDPHMMRRLMEYGTLSEMYVDKVQERIAMFQERDNKLAKESAAN